VLSKQYEIFQNHEYFLLSYCFLPTVEFRQTTGEEAFSLSSCVE
jgi:hypothetical protein